MTTLELFKKHRNGEVSRERFLYEVRRDNNLPWITNVTSYDDAVKILKNKGIIREAAVTPENVTTDPIVDRVNPYALKREVEKILADEPELNNNSYIKALNKAAKKLTDPANVKKAMFANAESVEKTDADLQTQEVKKANHVDKDNAMEKAKGQEKPKAMSAPTGENKTSKKPKGVEIMKDKGVEGSEKVIKEITSYLKKKLSENSAYHDHMVGQKVPTPHGEAVIKEINGGTCTVETKDGKLYDVQMNTIDHMKKEQKDPQHKKEIGVHQYKESGYDQLGEDEYDDLDDEVETPLQVGDIVLVTYPNEYQGERGEVVELGRGGSFVIVEMPDGNTVSMHSSDVELSDENDNWDEMDGEYDLEELEKVVDKTTKKNMGIFKDKGAAQSFIDSQPSNIKSDLAIG